MKKHHIMNIVAVGIVISAFPLTALASDWHRSAHKHIADSVHSLGEVVVTGSNEAVSSNLMPYTVSVVTHKDLEATGQTQLLSAISGQVPSLFVTQRGIFGFGVSNGGSGHIKMRGVGGDRASGVLMMVDGQPQFAGIYSHHVADFYQKEFVERVEVLRGPGSVLYGSNAMAGAVNVITRKPKGRGVKTTLTSQYGSYNTWLSSLTNTVRLGRFSSLVSLSYDRTDGNVKHFDFSQASGYAKVAYEFSDKWNAYADYTLMNFRGNDPVYPRLSNPESTAVYHQNVTRGEASVVAANNYGSTNGTARIYYSYGNHYIDDPNHFHSLDDRLGVMLYQNINPWREGALTVGFDFNTYSGEIPMSGGKPHQPGAMATIGRKSITEYSPYLTISQGLLDRLLTINAGLRMANSDMFGTQWVPQAGVAANFPAGFSAKASAAMGYRNPSFRELYFYKFANQNLQPERMWNYEVSAGKRFGRYLSVDMTLYLSRGDNMIQTASIHNEATGGTDMKNLNTGSFTNKGVELSVRSHATEGLTLSGSYSFMHTSLDNLTGAPRHQYYIGADWQALKWLNVCADLKGVAGLFVADDVARQNYALFNLKLTGQVCKPLALFVRLENITDARYVINRGYEMPGFTAMGGFRLTL